MKKKNLSPVTKTVQMKTCLDMENRERLERVETMKCYRRNKNRRGEEKRD